MTAVCVCVCLCYPLQIKHNQIHFAAEAPINLNNLNPALNKHKLHWHLQQLWLSAACLCVCGSVLGNARFACLTFCAEFPVVLWVKPGRPLPHCLSLSHQWDVYNVVITGSKARPLNIFRTRGSGRGILHLKRGKKKAGEGQPEKESAPNFQYLD